MTAKEIAWRIQSAVRDVLDRFRIPSGIYPGQKDSLNSLAETDSPFRLVDFPLGSASVFTDEWRVRLFSKADRLCEHKFSFFDLENKFLGAPIDWHKDHGSGKQAPRVYASKIDYRDFDHTGDCKLVWEPSRHHQLVVLARAYRITGELKYAQEVIDQIESWLTENPFGFGMNWRSPMEISIRVLNWTWALDLIRETGLFAGETRKKILHSVYLHIWDVTRKFSRGSSANNHVIGEAAGVFIASCYFPELNNTEKWRRESWEILNREIHAQTYDDGCNKELAYGYQLFVMQFFLFSGIVARKAGCDFPESFWKKLEKMMEFTGALVEAGGLPNYGDADDGYVLDLGSTHSDPKYALAVGAILFKRSDFKAQAGEFPEPVFWLLGPESLKKYSQLQTPKDDQLISRAFPESGFYLLQSGSKNNDDQISVLFDCGELGFQSIAAHGHADALSFTLRLGGEDIFIDPGTYDYFTYPEFRHYFRSTRAHNTVEIDDQDQSEILGPFMWGKRAFSRCLQWSPGQEGQGGIICAEHDGYSRFAGQVIHRRSLKLDHATAKLSLNDEIMAPGLHKINMYFHLGDGCKISETTNKCYEIVTKKEKKVIMEIDQRVEVEIFYGANHPIIGWFSNSYHRKKPIYVLKCGAMTSGNDNFSTFISVP